MKKRILSLALAMTLALGFSVTAFADEKTTTVTTTVPDPEDAITYTFIVPATLEIQYGVDETEIQITVKDVSPLTGDNEIYMEGAQTNSHIDVDISYTDLTSGENTLPVKMWDQYNNYDHGGSDVKFAQFQAYPTDTLGITYGVDWTNAKPGNYTGTITWRAYLGI